MNIVNTYSKLPNIFFHRNLPVVPSNPKTITYNYDLANLLGVNFSDTEVQNIFSGTKLPKGFDSISMNYCGHQFGHFNPQLGDGRAHLIAEVRGPDKFTYDIQLKGSGQSQFSRSGDGLSPLGPVIREYILSEAMNALGVPTTRALCCVSSGDTVYRELMLPGGIFTRVSRSLLRVGNFEYFASRNDFENLKVLGDYTIERLYPELLEQDNKYLNFFKSVARKNIDLVSRWMSLGFIHGVMNTDNTSIFGLTIDFGPCAFLDEYQANKVFSSIDRNSRYSFENQKDICLWNLSILARCLMPLIKEEMKESEDKIINILEEEFEILKTYSNESYLNHFSKKFGLKTTPIGFKEFIRKFLSHMEIKKLDFTNTFFDLRNRHFPNEKLKEDWLSLLRVSNLVESEAYLNMEKFNPYIIPRNHQVEKAIQDAYVGDFDHFNFLNKALQDPYSENLAYASLQESPKAAERIDHTFCGT